MANFRIWIAAVLAALASLLPAQENTPPANGGKPADAAARAGTTTIGVVDLDKAIDQYPKAIAERDKLQKFGQSLNERMAEQDKRINQIKAELSLLKEGSEERDAKEFEYGMALQDSKSLGSFLKAQYDRKIEKFEIAIYQDLEFAVKQVAKDRGVQIVLRMQGPFDEAGKDPANAQRARFMDYNRRGVWYAADEVDLTPALIKYLQVPLDLPKTEAGKPEAGKTAPSKTEVPPAPKPAGNGNGGQ